MRSFRFRRYWSLGLLAIPLAFAATAFRAPQPVSAPQESAAPQPPTVVVSIAAFPPTNTAQPAPASPTDVSVPAATLRPAQGAAPTPRVEPSPTPRPPGTPLRVGLQVGHWKANELPDELARLRTSAGAFTAGHAEVDVNLDIARRVAALLEDRGVVVDLLPATVPVDYDADAFVAIHADGSASAGARGFKIATPWRASRAAQQLLDALTAEYATATGLPWDDAITFNMRGYYAFNYRRHDHTVAKTTPAVIIEMGFLTSAADRAVLIDRPNQVAAGIARGIARYFGERDPNDGAALLPPEFKVQRSISPDGLDVRAAPRDDAQVLLHADADRRFNPLQERGGWYQVFVRDRERQAIGWVNKDQVTATDDPTPTPPPAVNP